MESQFGEYEIVKYRPEYRSQLLELQTHMWSPDLEKNAAFLKWKYYENPYVEDPIIYLALHAGQVVGMEGMFGTCWQAGQPCRTFRCLLTADAVVHPDHRRRGLFETITTAILRELSNHNYEYIFALTANQASSSNFLKLGWRRAESMQIAVRHAEPASSSLRRFAHKLPLLPSAYRRLRNYKNTRLLSSADNQSPFDDFDRNSARSGRDMFPYVHLERAPRPEAMARLVERTGNDGRMRHIRDNQFFAWRFRNPLSQFRFMYWEDAGLEGYLVLQTANNPAESTWVNIVDWEATTIKAQAELLCAALQWSNFDMLTVWSATLTDEVKMLLVESGFHFLEEADSLARGLHCPSFLVRPVRQETLQLDLVVGGRWLLKMSDWDVRAIYSDDY